MYVPETLVPFWAWNSSHPEYSTFQAAFVVWRNLKLCESDFMALGDTPTMSTDWATFRQSLRDLPSNANYPQGLIDPTFVPLDPNGE